VDVYPELLIHTVAPH